MSFFKDKLGSLSGKVSEAVASGKDALIEAQGKGVEYSQKVSSSVGGLYASTKESLAELAETTAKSSVVVVTKEKAVVVSDSTKAAYEKVSVGVSTAYSSSSERVKSYANFSSEKISSYFSSAIEIDKDTQQIVAEIQNKLPVRAKDLDDIFAQTKHEALRRAISAFCLAPIVSGLDKSNELKYANLSLSYGEFKSQNNLHDNKNFAELNNLRDDTRKGFTQFAGIPGAVDQFKLDNGYNSDSSARLDPFATDIEHIIPKKEIYNEIILKLATNDDQIIEAINFKQNLIFADDSLNGSKSDIDLIDYINKYGTPDPNDPDKITFVIGKNQKEVTISKSDSMEKYEAAQEELARIRQEAMVEIGLSLASAGARMAAQQVVGVIVAETVDLFVDEIKDITERGLIVDKKGVMNGLDERRIALSAKLNARFEERQIMQQAKAAGIEGGVAGVLSAVPQILISMLIKLPALVLSIIRECTLSTVRCVRVMLSDATDKYQKISIVMMGAATTVIGLYVATVLSKALATVPLLNLFNHSVADVLTGVLVTAVPLAAIYVFDQNKSKFLFTKVEVSSEGDEDLESPLPA